MVFGANRMERRYDMVHEWEDDREASPYVFQEDAHYKNFNNIDNIKIRALISMEDELRKYLEEHSNCKAETLKGIEHYPNNNSAQSSRKLKYHSDLDIDRDSTFADKMILVLKYIEEAKELLGTDAEMERTSDEELMGKYLVKELIEHSYGEEVHREEVEMHEAYSGFIETCVEEMSCSDGKTGEVEMLDEVELSSNGKTRVTTGNEKSGVMSSRLVEPSPRLVPLLSSSDNKERIMENVQYKLSSAIQIMKSSGGSKFLLENDPEFKNHYKALMRMTAKIKKNDSKKKKYDRRAKKQKENRRRGKKSIKEFDGVGHNNDLSRSRIMHDNGFSTREDRVNKLHKAGGKEPLDDPGKDPGKLRPSHKLKEKVNSKCSTVWKIKNNESNRAHLKWDKSGGEPTSMNKRFNLGLDPPKNPTFRSNLSQSTPSLVAINKRS